MFSLSQLIQQQNPHSQEQPSVKVEEEEQKEESSSPRPSSSSRATKEQKNDDDRKPAAKRKRTDDSDANKNKDEKEEEEEDEEEEEFIIDDEKDFLNGGTGGGGDDVLSDDDADGFRDKYPEAVRALYANYDDAILPMAAPSNIFETIHEALVPTQKATWKRIPRVERFQPQTRRVRVKGVGLRVRTETTQQANQRVLRVERYLEMNQVKERWKNRKFNYRQEADVGGAYHAKAMRLLGDKIRKEVRKKQRKEKRRRTSERVKREEELQEADDDDESVDEQNQLLERLTQPNEDDNSKATDAEEVDLAIPYEQRMDYWAYGRDVPGPKDLAFHYLRDSILTVDDPAQRKLIQEEKEEPGHKVKIGELISKGMDKENRHCARLYFPLNESTSGIMGRFGHWKNLRCMAARYLCGGVGDDPCLEDRYIRSLLAKSRTGLKEPLAYTSQQRSILTLSRQQGLNLLFYLRNAWSDPGEAARELGLLGQCSLIMTGRTLKPTNIQNFLKGRRTRVQNKYGHRAIPWTHPKEQEDRKVEEDREDSDIEDTKMDENAQGISGDDQGSSNRQKDHPSTAKDKDCLTIAGVVVDLQTGDEPKNINTQGDAALIAPTSTFSHIAGTKPPIPSFPQNMVSVIFGPVDRHAKFYHQVKVDETVYRLTLSTLLSRVARISSESNNKAKKDDMSAVQKQLQALVLEYAEIHETKLYRLNAKMTSGTFRDLPLVQYYRGMMGYCSFFANGCPSPKDSQAVKAEADQNVYGDDDSDNDLYGDSSDTINFLQNSGMQTVANEIWDYLQTRIQHNGLLRVPRLRLTFALASVCRRLPSSAAELLSRSMNEGALRTPLDVIKLTLEHMESNDMISSRTKSISGEEAMPAGELEYLMHEAAKILRECIKVDFVNVDYHMWYIGARAATLLLCSGNEIGSGARLFPSARKKNTYQHLSGETDDLSHEVRQRLPKFNEVRVELTEAVKLLFTLAQYQKGPRVHQAVSSLLEWSQVIALLSGESLEGCCEEIRDLHRFHVCQWALQDRGSSARAYTKRQQNSRNLSVLAQELENEPGKIENWRRFVRALGPLGSLKGESEDRTTHRNECPGCRRLRETLVIDHETRRKASWWGKQREWWVSGLLQMKPMGGQRRNQSRTEAVMRKIEMVMPELAHKSSFTRAFDDHGAFESPIQTTEHEHNWLPAEPEIRDGEPEEEARLTTYDSELPLSFLEVMDKPDGDCDVSLCGIPGLSGADDLRHEVECYSLLICCHLKDTGDAVVQDHSYSLIRSCSDALNGLVKEGSDEFFCLLWLCSMGLDVPQMARDKYPKRERQPLKNFTSPSRPFPPDN
jgi:hypothetical protein